MVVELNEKQALPQKRTNMCWEPWSQSLLACLLLRVCSLLFVSVLLARVIGLITFLSFTFKLHAQIMQSWKHPEPGCDHPGYDQA